MGMTLISKLFTTKLRATTMAASVLVLSAGVTHAGFEWVPADPIATPAPAVERFERRAVPEDDALSPLPPLPSQELLEAPVVPASPEPVNIARERVVPEPIDALPMLEAEPVVVQNVPEPQVVKPKQVVISNNDDIVPEDFYARPTIKTKSFSAPQTLAEPAAAAVEKPMAVTQEEPVIVTAPKTNVILSEDAPVSARNNLENSKTLLINPNPPLNARADIDLPENTSKITFESADIPQDQAVGFGNDIPLALALQQVAPAGYAFSFGESINVGQRVSWNGGKIWTTVIDEMIAPLGLSARIEGKSIHIHNRQHSSVMPQEPSMPSAISLEMTEPAAGPSAAPVANEATAPKAPSWLRRTVIQDPGQSPDVTPGTVTDLADMNAVPERTAPLAMIEKKPASHIIWEAENGDSLKQTLQSWSKIGKFELEWNAPHDYSLQSNVLVAGKIDNALKVLMNDGLSGNTMPSLSYKTAGDDAPAKLVVDAPVI